MIENFTIKNLFDFRTIEISFDDPIKILIGENGLGKTTVLNALYYVLTERYQKLSQINFESICLSIKNKENEIKTIDFTKDELIGFVRFTERKRRGRLIDHLQTVVSLDELKSYLDEMITDKEAEGDAIFKCINKFVSSKPELRGIAPASIISKELLSFIKEPIFDKFSNFSMVLKDLDFNILYFPTYRRVEEDLKNIGKIRRQMIPAHLQEEMFIEELDDFEEKTDISEDTLIHFGMDDVTNRIKNLEDQINKSTISGFSKVTGEMLSQLLKGFPDIDDSDIEKIDTETAKIVLDRVGNNLSEYDRRNILSLLNQKKGLKSKKEFVHFLFKLIDIYNQHKHIDDSIKQFRDVCNNYLVDKDFIYDESAVTLRIYRADSKIEEVPLDRLSSGEKQIVSLFSKIYLEHTKNLLVLFDEPELSLSIEWQKMLLPDIVKSGKCKFLLSVTHSPFIFKNNLDKYAVGMSIYTD